VGSSVCSRSGGTDPVEVTLNGERVRVVDNNTRGPLRLKIPAGTANDWRRGCPSFQRTWR
jgi:hypothetical protein